MRHRSTSLPSLATRFPVVASLRRSKLNPSTGDIETDSDVDCHLNTRTRCVSDEFPSITLMHETNDYHVTYKLPIRDIAIC